MMGMLKLVAHDLPLTLLTWERLRVDCVRRCLAPLPYFHISLCIYILYYTLIPTDQNLLLYSGSDSYSSG